LALSPVPDTALKRSATLRKFSPKLWKKKKPHRASILMTPQSARAGQRADHAFRHQLTYGPGLPVGTRILTRRGDIAVEDLQAGDHVICRRRGFVAVTGLEKRAVTGRMVRIRAGSLGKNLPTEEATVAADQTLLVRDWHARVLHGTAEREMSAVQLVDDEFIVEIGHQCRDMVRILCAEPAVLYAGGLEVVAGCKASQTLPA
jgi:hypothetical protein